MTREDIINYLEREYEADPQKWHTSKEIGEAVGIGGASVCTNLKKLRKYGEVSFETRPAYCNGKKPFVYRKKEYM